jgi:RNA polymerase sigma factor (sigma-70 family)
MTEPPVQPGPAEPREPSDAELIAAVRAQDDEAFGVLWERHAPAARRVALMVAPQSEADDLVSEGFARVLTALRSGGGPDAAFRTYLISTVRRASIDIGRGYRSRVVLTDDVDALDTVDPVTPASALDDLGDARAAWAAWQSLPEESQVLLWHLLVEEETPATLAPLLGTTPNGVSSRAKRAKERLRQAFLDQHLASSPSEECRRARHLFSAYVRDGLAQRDRVRLEEHLQTCARCRGALLQITQTNETMRGIIAPLVLGPLVAGYLASAGSLGTLGAASASASASASGGAGVGGAADLLRHLPRPGQPALLAGGAAAVVALLAAVALTTSGDREGPGAAAERLPPTRSTTAATGSATLPPPSDSATATTTTAPVQPSEGTTAAVPRATVGQGEPDAAHSPDPEPSTAAGTPTFTSTSPATRPSTTSSPTPTATTTTTPAPVTVVVSVEPSSSIYYARVSVTSGWRLTSIVDSHDGVPFEHLAAPVSSFEHHLRPGPVRITAEAVAPGKPTPGWLHMLFTATDSSSDPLPASGDRALP